MWIKHRNKIFWLLIILAIGLLYVIKTYPPEAHRFYLKCPLYTFTGLKCSGCGNQRAVHALLNAQWATAWKANPTIYFLLPYFSIGFLLHFLSKKSEKYERINKKLFHPNILISIFIALILFGILRNIF